MRRRQTLYGEPAASACISTANALPVLTPFARPRTLRGSPRRGGTHSSPSGSPLSPLSAGWAALLSPIASDTLALPTSPPPDGLPSSEPRSVRADVIPGSERRATFATRQRGGGARRVDRGRRVVHLWSAEPRSVRDQPPAPARVTRPHIAPPLRLILYLHRSILYPRRPLSSLLLPDGLASSEPRSVRADVIPGSERHAAHRHASAGRWSAPRRPGEERAVPRSAELRSLRGQPPAPARATRRHIAPALRLLLDPAPLYPLSPPLSLLSPLSSCRMGWRPRSRGACGQTVSPVRSGAPPLPRVSGGEERVA